MSTLIPAEITKRHFLAPVALALSAHAVVLFGFSKDDAIRKPSAPPRWSSPKLPQVQRIDFFPPPDEEPIAKNEPAAADPRNNITDKFIKTKFDFPGPEQAPIVPIGPGSIMMPSIGVHGPSGSNGGPGSSEVSLDKLDNQPRAISQPAPVCPFEAKRSELSGQVEVMFTVDESGRVLKPQVLNSTDPIFEEPTLCAVEQWRFTPGTVKGIPVRFRMRLSVAFNVK